MNVEEDGIWMEGGEKLMDLRAQDIVFTPLSIFTALVKKKLICNAKMTKNKNK